MHQASDGVDPERGKVGELELKNGATPPMQTAEK